MISIIVCTFNRADILVRMLDSFFAQPERGSVPHELILVDNNSTDHTARVASEFAELPAFRCVCEPRQGLSHARNRGVREARGEIVAFLDDDVIVDAEWLRHLHACFSETGATVVGGRSYLICARTPPSWLGPHFRRALSEVDFGRQRRTLASGDRLYGLNLAFRKDALLATGGFDPTLGRKGAGLLAGEETVVMKRIVESGGTIVYDPAACVGHLIERRRLAWAYFERHAIGTGRSAALADPAGTRSTRIASLIEAGPALADALIRLARATLYGPSAYEWRVAQWRLLRVVSLLWTRITRL